MSLRPLESAFLSLSLPDIFTILQKKLRSYISRRLIILLVTFYVSKAYKVVKGKFQGYSWKLLDKPLWMLKQFEVVWKLKRLWWFFFSHLNVHNIRLYQVFNYFQWGFSRNITSSSVSPIFFILDILTLILKPTFLLMCSTQPVLNCISLCLFVNNTRSSAKYKSINSLSYQTIPKCGRRIAFFII